MDFCEVDGEMFMRPNEAEHELLTLRNNEGLLAQKFIPVTCIDNVEGRFSRLAHNSIGIIESLRKGGCLSEDTKFVFNTRTQETVARLALDDITGYKNALSAVRNLQVGESYTPEQN